MVNDMENVLESIGVTKNYAGKAAVDNVSFTTFFLFFQNPDHIRFGKSKLLHSF